MIFRSRLCINELQPNCGVVAGVSCLFFIVSRQRRSRMSIRHNPTLSDTFKAHLSFSRMRTSLFCNRLRVDSRFSTSSMCRIARRRRLGCRLKAARFGSQQLRGLESPPFVTTGSLINTPEMSPQKQCTLYISTQDTHAKKANS